MVTLDYIREQLEKKLQIDHMLKTIEVRADTLEEALADAAVQLEVSSKHLEYEIVERGSAGVMGISKKPWCIHVYPSAASVLEKKRQETDSSTTASDENLEPVIIDKDGEAFIRYFGGTIFMKSVLPVADGFPVQEAEVFSKLSRSDVISFDEAKIREFIASGTDENYEPVGTFNHSPGNDSYFAVDISSDEMTVTILANEATVGGSDISAERITQLLGQYKVAVGIDPEKISDFVDNPVYGQPVIVAEGIPAKDGADAYIAYNFETDTSKLRLKETESGQIDFKELNLIQNVVEGQPLAQKILPERGSPGKTVMGRYLDAKNGKDIPIPLGKNVALDTDGRTVIAQTNGQVLLIGNKISVEPIMQVDGNVGIKTGHISFLGTVIVKGDVEDGFNVKAAGNIEIYGSVGKSMVEADGDIIVSLGIMGHDEGCVRAGKSLWAKFIQNTKVDAEENVIVADGIINSKVTCNQKVIASGKRGAIIGGHVFATEEINCKNIGASGGGETILEVGFDPKSKLRLDELNEMQSALVKELEEISLNLSTLENTKKIRRQLPPDKEESLIELTKRKHEIIDETDQNSEELEKIQSHLKELKILGKVSASGTVFPGAKIFIRDTKEEVRTELTKVTFFLQDGFVRQGAYEPVSNDVRKTPDGYSAD